MHALCRHPFVAAVATASFLLAAAAAHAQQIGGTVTDATGGVLPGVTVDARSPSIIEGVRTAVTDGSGQYLIVALEPGTYAVTYSLPGFGTLIREGIELSTGFTANVDVQLSVGDIAETVTVSGASPVVDIQNVEQRQVMDREIIDSIPTGKGLINYGLLIPGMVGAESYGTALSQDSGGLTAQTSQRMSIHGGEREDQVITINGMDVANPFTQGANLSYFPDTNFEEIAFNYSANSAEIETGGVNIDMIPREGANEFGGSIFTTFSGPALHADNLDADLIAGGLTSPTLVDRNYTIAPSFGGPIVRDKLWFFVTHSSNIAFLQTAGVFHPTQAFQDLPTRELAGIFTFMPDESRPGIDATTAREQSLNITWQATSKDKVKAYWTNSNVDAPHSLQGQTLGSIFLTPEAALKRYVRSNGYQVNWTRPHTNRLLFEFGMSHEPIKFRLDRAPGARTDVPGVLEVAPVTAFRNMAGWLSGPHFRYTPKRVDYYRGSVSYVTGSHNLKVGFSVNPQWTHTQQVNDADGIFHWSHITTLRGRPFRATYWGTSSSTDEANSIGIYAQEQWTIDRLTINAGLRYDHITASYPDQTRPANQWVPQPFDISGLTAVRWSDIQPRLGAAYDLRGDGRTALKFSVSRYGRRDSTDWAQRINPALSNRRMDRSWSDSGCIATAAPFRNWDGTPAGTCIAGDGIVQGDPTNFAPNGELSSPNRNPLFGQPVRSIFYDESWDSGWGNRFSNWEYAASVQQELVSGVSLDVGYFRRNWVHHSVLDDTNLVPEDFNTLSVTVPEGVGLPNGGQVLTFYDLKPESAAKPQNELRLSSEAFGGERESWQGFDFTIDARAGDVLLQGGLSTGRHAYDFCDILGRLPESAAARSRGSVAAIPQRAPEGDTVPLEFCSRTENWLSYVKFLGSYTFPGDVQFAATLQNQPGPERQANVQFAQSAVSGGQLVLTPSRVELNVVEPGSWYGDRYNQLDIRVTKIFTLANFGQFRAMFDLYNLFNANTITIENVGFGASTGVGAGWLSPRSFMPGRLAKFAFQLDF